MKSTNSKNKTNKSAMPQKEFLFGQRNYKLLFIALGLIALGFILMTGGGSDNPEVFNPEIFSFRRIRLAPTLVLAGFGVAMYSILAAPKK